MKSRCLAALAVALIAAPISGCGHTPISHHPVGIPGPSRCELGIMGGCVPHPAPSKGFRLTAPFGRTLIPDVSEYQACALYSEAIFRVYEAGTGREDSKAACHARELKRLHAWSAAYAFARPPGYGHAGSCTAQADVTVRIVRSLGGIVGPVILDDEVPLPRGFARCFNRRVRSNGYRTVTYTAPGTVSGGPIEAPVWGADYGAELPCIESVCRFVAHQFSSDYVCRGIRGDCSTDSGLLRIRERKTPSSKHLLYHYYRVRKELRADLMRHNCRRGPVKPGSYRRTCRYWLVEGRLVNHRIRVYHARHIY
jgi:hypothetical protein